MGLSSYLGLTGGFDAQSEVRRLRREVDLLKQQVEMLARAQQVDLGRVQPPLPVSKAVIALLAQGKDIAAIKAHREETGLGLAEAKQDIDEAKARRLR